ncbi:integrin beta-8 [Neosynchiropus ocellatus]
MTPWPFAFGRFPRCLPLCLVVLAACAGAARPGEGECWSSRISSCTECLARGPQCTWCFKQDFLEGASSSYRCDLPASLLKRGCEPEFMEQTEIKVEVNATISSTQVSPRDISIHLRPGSHASFIVAVKQLPRYPVDLYYLVDVSASMQENLDHLKTVGVALTLRMTEHSSDLWLGFGSFVDKPVSPYINVHPSKINNPCSDYEIRCRPAHGFHHVLSMTGNMSEFTRVIKRQRISGNMDTPEGGLDAMLQAAVCQKAVGWRSEAKHLLLLMTDQPSHLALDSRLAGIVAPHDGQCHLENNVYTGSTRMDHPTLGQLSDKLLENNIYSIFAVENKQQQWYEELVHLLPGSYLGKLGIFQAPNLIDLVVDAYKRLLSEVDVSVTIDDQAVSRYWVSVSPLCPPGSTADGSRCTGVKPEQTVYFNITVGQHSCATEGEDEEITMMVRPIGYNESTKVRIHSRCRCSCGSTGRCQDGNLFCSTEGTKQEHQHELNHGDSNCRADGSTVDCSGRGTCLCGRCACEQSRLGLVHGKYCQIDDFSCPYHDGLLCGGRGVCVLGECKCEEQWGGESCSCPTSTDTCQSPDGSMCSGRGRCVCGKCLCDDPKFLGNFCERCPLCQNSCQAYWKCVDCHLSQGLALADPRKCNSSCASSVDFVDDVSGQTTSAATSHSGEILCKYISNDSCRYRFQTSSESGEKHLYISTRPECSSRGQLVGTFLSVCALTVMCGLVVVVLSRMFVQNRRRAREGAAEVEDFICTGKDLSYIPTTNEKTVTYRRDCPSERPVEMDIHVPKMPLGDPWP